MFTDVYLGEDIELLRDTVKSFAAEEIAPRAEQIDKDNLFPADLWQKMGDLGLLGNLPQKPSFEVQ